MRELDWRTRAFVVGGLAGALLGLGAAYIYVNAAEQEGIEPELHPGQLVGIGLALLALLRQIATLHEGEGEQEAKKLR